MHVYDVNPGQVLGGADPTMHVHKDCHKSRGKLFQDRVRETEYLYFDRVECCRALLLT